MRTRYLEPRVPLVPPPGRRERLAVAVPLPLTGGAALEVEGWAGPELWALPLVPGGDQTMGVREILLLAPWGFGASDDYEGCWVVSATAAASSGLVLDANTGAEPKTLAVAPKSTLVRSIPSWPPFMGLPKIEDEVEADAEAAKLANVGVAWELPGSLTDEAWGCPPKKADGTWGDAGFSEDETNLGVLGTTLSSASSNCPI